MKRKRLLWKVGVGLVVLLPVVLLGPFEPRILTIHATTPAVPQLMESELFRESLLLELERRRYFHFEVFGQIIVTRKLLLDDSYVTKLTSLALGGVETTNPDAYEEFGLTRAGLHEALKELFDSQEQQPLEEAP